MAALEEFVVGMLRDTSLVSEDPKLISAFTRDGPVSKLNAQLHQWGLVIEVGPGRRGGTPVFDESRITVRLERAD